MESQHVNDSLSGQAIPPMPLASNSDLSSPIFGAQKVAGGQMHRMGMWRNIRIFIKFICKSIKIRTKCMKKNLKKCFARFSVLIRSGHKKVTSLRLLKEAFTQQSPTIKKSLLFHTSTNVALSFNLFVQQIGEISATCGANMGNIALGTIGLVVEVCNIMQMSVRMMSFLKLYVRSKKDPSSLSKAEQDKLAGKLSKVHISLILTEAFTSLTGMMSHVFRIASAFLPGFALVVIIPTLISSIFSTFNAVLSLMEAIKQPRGITKKTLLLHVGIILLNMLATSCFLSQAILTLSPTPLSLIATLSFAILQFVYIGVNMSTLKMKIDEKLSVETTPSPQVN